VSKKGLKKEFFNYLAIDLLLQPQIQYKTNNPPILKEVEEPIILKNDNQPTPPVVNQRAYYDLQLANWYEIKSLAIEHTEEGQEWFNENFQIGLDENQERTGFFLCGQGKITALKARKENLKHFKKYSIRELEAIMLQEYTVFSLSTTDFNGCTWLDTPLTDKERAMFETIIATTGTTQKLKALKKSDFPQGIQILAKEGLLEWLPRKNTYILRRQWELTTKTHGKWKLEAESLLKEKKIKPEWERWSKEGYIVKQGGEKYATETLMKTLKVF
jgi:hypothetical protein